MRFGVYLCVCVCVSERATEGAVVESGWIVGGVELALSGCIQRSAVGYVLCCIDAGGCAKVRTASKLTSGLLV